MPPEGDRGVNAGPTANDFLNTPGEKNQIRQTAERAHRTERHAGQRVTQDRDTPRRERHPEQRDTRDTEAGRRDTRDTDTQDRGTPRTDPGQRDTQNRETPRTKRHPGQRDTRDRDTPRTQHARDKETPRTERQTQPAKDMNYHARGKDAVSRGDLPKCRNGSNARMARPRKCADENAYNYNSRL